MDHIVRLSNYNYGSVFHHFNMEFERGKITAIAGNNSSGKTSLIKAISGLLPFEKKTISVNYVYLESIGREFYKKIGVCIPEMNLPFLKDTVYQELSFPLENLNFSKRDIEKRVDEIKVLFHFENIMLENPSSLEQIDKHKLYIALAIIHRPILVLLDDPFLHMSLTIKKEIWRILKTLNEKENISIIFTSNNLTDCLLSDYLYLLDNGKVVIEGIPVSVMKEEKIINRLGLDLPFMIDLSSKLIFYELLNEIILDLDGMVNKLWK